MFELETANVILNRMLNEVNSLYPGLNTRESSPIYLAQRPYAIQLYEAFLGLDNVLNESFADTATLEYLKRRAAERGITQRLATPATVRGVFTPTTIDVIGERFSYDGTIYVATEYEFPGSYVMVCETSGVVGNVTGVPIIPVNYINGLATAQISAILIPGEDDEDVEALRQRYFNSLTSQAFGGNRADYTEKVTAIPGVGGVKIIRAWAGGGTVKLIIIGSDWGVPSAELVDTVQTEIDPTVNQGDGLGLAPLDHVVTVVACGSTTINITTTLTFSDGYDWATLQSAIDAAIDSYLTELSQSWSTETNVIVRISQVESRLLDIVGILDVDNTSINGTASNATLPEENIPVRGSVTSA